MSATRRPAFSHVLGRRLTRMSFLLARLRVFESSSSLTLLRPAALRELVFNSAVFRRGRRGEFVGLDIGCD